MSEEELEEEDDECGGRSEPPINIYWAGGHQHCKEILLEVCCQQ